MTTIERILELMKEQKVTKYELHKLTGISRSTIYSIFDKKTNVENVKIDHIRAIAKALNTTIDYLTYGKEGENLEARQYNRIIIETEFSERIVYNVSLEQIKAITTILNEMEKSK